jgi:hypothetical protein
MNKPKDMRGNVVFELLLTERKYVQDLEALQVIILSFSFFFLKKKKKN